MELSAELQASLQGFIATRIVEVRENGGTVTPFSGMSWEVRGSAEKPLLHLWSEQFNLTRRVVAITDHSEHRLALAGERFAARNRTGWSSFAENSRVTPTSCPARNSATA